MPAVDMNLYQGTKSDFRSSLSYAAMYSGLLHLRCLEFFAGSYQKSAAAHKGHQTRESAGHSKDQCCIGTVAEAAHSSDCYSTQSEEWRGHEATSSLVK